MSKSKPSFGNLREKRNAYRYAWRNGPRWAFEYLCEGRVLAAFRQLWNSLVHGHISESCQECGRAYPLWTAAHDLYAKVTGYDDYTGGTWNSGLFCINCFDRIAGRMGIHLRWIPEIDRSCDWEDCGEPGYLLLCEKHYLQTAGIDKQRYTS